MPEIPVSKNGLIQHTAAGSPMSGHSLHYYGDDGTAKALGNFGRSFSSALGAVAEFKKEFDETENRLSATEARNLFAKINGDLQDRMKKNPGSFSEFKTWAEEADKLYAEKSKVFLDRMTDKFRKQFEADMQGLRIEAFNRRRDVGTQAAVSANYSRFQTLFKEAAERDPQEAMRLLEQHKGVLISPQEYQTRKEIDLPRISQSAQMRREVEANTPGIIEKLSATDGKGNFTNFTAVTPEFRQSMIRYAEAKDSQKRAEELYQFAEELDSGRPISRQMIEDSFAGKTSAADLKQKQTMIQMLERKESARERATTAANARREEAQFQADWARIVNAEFPHDVNARQKMYAEMRQYIIGAYHGKGSRMETLLKKLDEYHKLPNSPAVKVKSTTLYQDGERILDGFKAQGRFFADGSWWKDDKKPGTVSYIEDVLKADMTEFCKNNPQATVQKLSEYLNERITTYNKSTVEQIADMQLKEAAKRQGERKNRKRTETLKDGTRGTFKGRKVIYKNGKWEYAK